MNRDDIIKLAREQGLPETETEGVFRVNTDDLGRMLAAEREACVQIIEEYRIPVGNSVAGELAREWTYTALKEIRDDIRARGNT
jgi:hypothetical protein